MHTFVADTRERSIVLRISRNKIKAVIKWLVQLVCWQNCSSSKCSSMKMLPDREVVHLWSHSASTSGSKNILFSLGRCKQTIVAFEKLKSSLCQHQSHFTFNLNLLKLKDLHLDPGGIQEGFFSLARDVSSCTAFCYLYVSWL